MELKNFDYNLPQELIAQSPAKNRDFSRLMIIDKKRKKISHDYFYNLPNILNKNFVLVFNNSKVIKARLYGKIDKKNVEILLVEKKKDEWEILAKPGKKFKIGKKIDFIKRKKIKNLPKLSAEITKINEDGSRIIKFNLSNKKLQKIIKYYGILPLPPYIKNYKGNEKRYQTIYAKKEGSIAAPTAGLHFTKEVLKKLKNKEIELKEITLHVGIGTFQEVRTEKIEDHKMHNETFFIDEKTRNFLNKAKKEGKKIIAVGTTSARVLETLATKKNILKKQNKKNTEIFIYPGYKFKFIDGLITNFHLPKSTLLMLVSAFAGKDLIKKAYQEAIKKKYRFFSFGDATIII